VSGVDPELVIRNTTLAGRAARVLELNRPAQRNCLSAGLMRQMIEAVHAASDALLVLGARGPAFCTGLDLREVLAAGSAGEHLSLLTELFTVLAAHPAPTVSLVSAAAYGGGVGLAWATDATLATATVKFVLPGEPEYRPLVEVLVPVIVARRAVPRSTVCGWIGTEVPAVQAERWGLVESCARDELESALPAFLQRRGLLEGFQHAGGLSAEVRGALAELVRAATAPAATRRLLVRLRQRYSPAS
jgi:enoyl-CoA hydratase/carnithine racemase